MSLNRVRLAQEQPSPFPSLFPDEKLYFSSKDPVQMEYDNSGGSFGLNVWMLEGGKYRRTKTPFYVGYPGSGQQLLIVKGSVFISNIRVLYLPHVTTVSFQSLSIPLQNLEDGKLSESWLGLGGCTYSGSVKSVQDEGFTNPWGIIKLSFSSSSQGPDFKNTFDHMCSRLGAAPMQYVEPLPTYSEPPPFSSTQDGVIASSSTSAVLPPPVDHPPSYN